MPQRQSHPADPLESATWHALGRECSLARQLIGTGVTALGRANYANLIGEYYTAFFGLSVGLERLTKLIIVADYAIAHAGQLPSPQLIRSFGHNLTSLIDRAEDISQRRSLPLGFHRPRIGVCENIMKCLDSFADAKHGRYSNFATIGDPALGLVSEPIRMWWTEVAEAILLSHYYETPLRMQVEERATDLNTLIQSYTFVMHFKETGDAMTDVRASSIHTAKTEVVQKYGRYYTLLVVRWLADLFSALSKQAAYDHQIGAFGGTWEHFSAYRLEDAFLRKRKRWPAF